MVKGQSRPRTPTGGGESRSGKKICFSLRVRVRSPAVRTKCVLKYKPRQGWGRGFESLRPLQISPRNQSAADGRPGRTGRPLARNWREARRRDRRWRERRWSDRRDRTRHRVRSCGSRVTCGRAAPPPPRPEHRIQRATVWRTEYGFTSPSSPAASRMPRHALLILITDCPRKVIRHPYLRIFLLEREQAARLAGVRLRGKGLSERGACHEQRCKQHFYPHQPNSSPLPKRTRFGPILFLEQLALGRC